MMLMMGMMMMMKIDDIDDDRWEERWKGYGIVDMSTQDMNMP